MKESIKIISSNSLARTTDLQPYFYTIRAIIVEFD